MEAMLIVKRPGRIFRDIWLIHDPSTKHDYAITLFEEDGKFASSFSLAQAGGIYEEGVMVAGSTDVVKAREGLWEIIRSYPGFTDLQVSHISNIDSENPQEALRAWSEANKFRLMENKECLN